MVKPATEGSTVGVTIVRGEDEVAGALEEAASLSSEVIVETYVPGRELAVGVLGDQALPVIEIEPEGGFYDYASKYTKGKSRYTVPARLPEATTARASEQAIRAFQVLGGRGFGRVDFRLREDGGLFCLELNTIPGLTETSLAPMAAKAAGMSYRELVERLVTLARESSPGV